MKLDFFVGDEQFTITDLNNVHSVTRANGCNVMYVPIGYHGYPEIRDERTQVALYSMREVSPYINEQIARTNMLDAGFRNCDIRRLRMH